MPNYNGVWSLSTQYQYAADWPDPTDSNRGLYAGGYGAPNYNNIEFFAIQTTGNSPDFGDLTVARRGHSDGSSSTSILLIEL